jgi:hypothetical protein
MSVASHPTAYVYLGGAGGLSTTPTVLGGLGAPFTPGGPVASAGDVNGDGFADVVVVGASAYVFLGSAGGVSTTPITLVEPDPFHRGYTPAVAAGAGDVNGDGYADVIVGTGEGTAYVYLGGSAGPSQTPAVLTDTSSSPTGSFGYAVESAGDVNGDGFADVLVSSANLYNDGTPASFLYLGGPGGITASTQPSTLAYGNGTFAASAGDVNGDGFDDVVAPSGYSSAYVFLGAPAGLSPKPIGLRSANTIYPAIGAGDVNGDGFADVICGSWGEVDVFLGAAGGIAMSPATALMGPTSGGFGGSIARSVLGPNHRRRGRYPALPRSQP